MEDRRIDRPVARERPRLARPLGAGRRHGDVVGEGAEATITRVEHLGDQTRLHLTLGPHALITLTEPHTPLKPGETLMIRPQNPLWFDASGARI